MSEPPGVEDLLRELAPQVLGAVVRRYGHFADAEDAVQEALVAAATRWRDGGVPDNPVGWLVRVAGRRMADQFRSDEARRRREDLAASWSRQPPEPVSGREDTLALFFMCCQPALTPASAVALTLRALGGLTTKEIAAAFLLPEPTMAQRISRAKRTLAELDAPFAVPDQAARQERLPQVLRVVYLVFNEGYATSTGNDLGRSDLAGEAIRLGRLLYDLLPEEAEVAGLLALMLLTEARRPARTTADGALVPLGEQDRARWDRALIAEGIALASAALERETPGEYATQAAIAALHDAAPRAEDTDWARILSLYGRLEDLTGSPVVRLNRAVALAEVEGPESGLALLDQLDAQGTLVGSHRLHAVRAHLLERKGDLAEARAEYLAGASGSANARERDYLVLRAAALAPERVTPPGGDGSVAQ